MKFKKAFAVILAVAMVITLMPSMAFASTTNRVSGISTVSKNDTFEKTLELEVTSDPARWAGVQEIQFSLDNAEWYSNRSGGKSYSRLTSETITSAVEGATAVQGIYTLTLSETASVAAGNSVTVAGVPYTNNTGGSVSGTALATALAAAIVDDAAWGTAVADGLVITMTQAMGRESSTAPTAGIGTIATTKPGVSSAQASASGTIATGDVLEMKYGNSNGYTAISTVKWVSNNCISFDVPDNLVQGDYIQITLSLKAKSTVGDVTVGLSSVSGDINTSSFTVATVVSGGTVANVPDDNTDDLETITIRNTNQQASDIVIRESSAGVLGSNKVQRFTLTLPKEVSWNTRMHTDATTLITGSLVGSVTASIDADNNRILNVSVTTTNQSSSSTVRRTLTITPIVNTTKDVNEGNLTVTLRGTDDISDASNLVIGKIGDTSVSVYVDEDDYDEGEIPEIYSGVVYEANDDDYLAIITIEETAEGDLTEGKFIDFTFDKAVQLTGTVTVEGTANDTVANNGTFENGTITYDKDRSTFGWKVTATAGSDRELVFKIPYTVEAGFEGDVECVVTGSAAGVSETTVVVAKAKPVVTVAATATDVRTGIQDQAIGDITITESEAGALSDDVKNDYEFQLLSTPADNDRFYEDDYAILGSDINAMEADIVIELPFELKEKPTAEVTNGDLEIKSDIVWSKNNAEYVGINIDAASVDTASTITISNLIVSLNRVPAEGYYDTEVFGKAIIQNAGFGKDQAFADSYTIEDSINVVTPADSSTIATKIDALFTIGSASYTNNGTAVEMDAAPYIDSNNRTMVPIRYIAEACGVANDDITWNQATQTATINGANTVVSITMGSSIITTSSGNITMDTVAVNNNGRIYVPLRYIANALGANVIWDGTARTITLTN